MANSGPPKLCLVDASGYIHRAFHALPPLTTSKGQPVHAIYGFSRMIAKILKAEQPDYLGVCFDTPKPTFRHDIFGDYKGTREEADEALVSQIPLVLELAEAWGLPCIKMDGFEADDVIATLTKFGRQNGCQVLILSGDKDVFQLVEDGVLVRDEIRKIDYNAERVKERFGVRPNQLIDYFSLMGDKIDNVSGVPGVGEKTAAKLISENGTLEGLYANLASLKPTLADKLEKHRASVFGNRILIELKKDVPLDVKLPQLVPGKPSDALTPLLQKLEFRGDLFGAEPELFAKGEVNTRRVVRVVRSENDLNELDRLVAASREVSYDLETDSIDHRCCRIVGVAISVAANEAWYIPVGHNESEQLPWDDVRPKVKAWLENTERLKIAQNVKFDNSVLGNHGVVPRGPFFDTMLAAYCLDPSRGGFGLKDLAADFLNERMTRIDELIGKTKHATMAEVPIEKAAPYAGADAEVTLRLKGLFDERLKKEGLKNLFDSFEMPLVQVLQAMERAGIRIDQDYLRNVGKDFDRQKKGLEREIFSLAGEEFLLNSPQQLSRILFEKLKLPPGKKNKNGYSTNEEVLRKLCEKHPICEKIIAYRELSKLISTYVEALLELVDQKTSRIHGSFNQTGAATGRLSSSDPNLQNIPIRTELGRQIRKAFVAEPGSVLVSADYSQIDLRALAHMSNDPVLVATFKRGGDIHAATAAEVFHVNAGSVTAEMRRRAKAINFGVVYGQQSWGLSQGLGIPVAEAEDFIRRYFEKYAGVKVWIDATLAEARKKGYVTTLAGRRRPVPDILSQNFSIRGFAERIAVNTPIQGTSADIIKMAMIRVQREIEQRRLKSRMLVQVHDELLFEVPKEELDAVLPLVREGMEKATDLAVPLVVDIKTGANWSEMAAVSLEAAA